MNEIWVIARHTFRECTRRRIFVIVPVVSLGFLALFTLGTYYAFRSTFGTAEPPGDLVDAKALTGASLMGLSMFTALFLGSALGIFLTHASIRGDAEQGILQALVVRPVARSGLLIGRFVGASIVCSIYLAVLYAGTVVITGAIGGWWPSPLLLPGLSLIAGVIVVIALTLLGSVFLPALPNGIVMFMIYGAGLLAGLLGQLGELLRSPALETTGRVASWVFPFEALYQAGLDSLTSGATGLTRVIVQLGPLGGATQAGPELIAWWLFYLGCVGAVAIASFRRKDL
ncbi:MAG: ABC transporter permease [Actinomycetota bacterium]